MSRAEAVRVEEAHASREKGESPLTRGLPAFQVLDEIAPPARQVGVNHGAALGEQPTDAARGQVSQHRSQLDIPFHVEQQAAPPPHGAWRPRWVAPPCPPPPHGWPIVLRRSDVELGYDLGDLELTGAAVAVTLFRLGPNRAVLVVAAGDVAAVEARLRPQLGDYLHYQWELWRLYGLGLHNTDDGQPHMAARLVRVLPEIAAWAATLPKRHSAAGAVAYAPES